MSYYLQSIQSETFLILLYSFTILEYSFFCYFIFLALPKTFTKKSVPFLWIGFLAFAFLDFINLNDKHIGFDSFAIGVESIIILLLCVSYLFIQIKKSNSLLIYSTFNFWVVITFLIYFAGTFFLYIMAEGLRHSMTFRRQYFIINISFNILKNILLCVAMAMKSDDTVNKQKNVIPELDDDFFIAKK